MLARTFDHLQQLMVRALQDIGDRMFAESQRIVPVDRGTLKRSGFIRYLPDGVEFGYRTPYAARVNFGLPAGYSEVVRRHTVRAHRRRVRTVLIGRRRYHWNPKTQRFARGSAYVQVRSHSRGPFVRRYPRGVQGSHYMERAVDKYMPTVGRSIASYIRRSSG
jgi:hypothetical protein